MLVACGFHPKIYILTKAQNWIKLSTRETFKRIIGPHRGWYSMRTTVGLFQGWHKRWRRLQRDFVWNLSRKIEISNREISFPGIWWRPLVFRPREVSLTEKTQQRWTCINNGNGGDQKREPFEGSFEKQTERMNLCLKTQNRSPKSWDFSTEF